MNPQDPLAQLRDIHLPAPVSWWPPAPGWWLLGVLLLTILIGTVWWLIRHYRVNRYRREALDRLASLQAQTGISHLQQCHALLALLRRTAKTAYPGRGLESTLLPEFFETLNNCCRKPVFEPSLQAQLGELPYQAEPDIPGHLLADLASSIQCWIKQHRGGRSC